LRPRWLAGAGLVTLLAAWPVFVFTGSQVSYVVSLAAACATAGALAAAASSLVLGYLIGLIAVVGPEVSGRLGNGHALLGSMRLLDAATVVAALVALARMWPPRAHTVVSALRDFLPLVTVATLAYATLRWGMEGHRIDSFLRADVRLILLGALFWLLATVCQRGGPRSVLWSIAAVGVIAAAKATAIHISGVYAIGSFDRLQASDLHAGGHLRTILVGGDTVLILAPAIAILLAWRAPRRTRPLLALAAICCLWALGLSATRTTALVSLTLVLATAVVMLVLARPRLSRSTVAVGCVAAALILGAGLSGGAVSRLAHRDAPHVGLNFRKDEIKSFFHAAATTKYLGQGLGGRFMSKDVNGNPALTGWAHELPVWLALKAGVAGLLAAGLALVVILQRAFRCLRARDVQVQALAGAALVVGLVTMSMTLDRIALPEGVPLLVIGVFLISSAYQRVMSMSR
jgi:hypothetical protein